MAAVVIVLLVIVLGGGLLIAGIAPVLAIASIGRDEKRQKEAEAGAPELLDAAFVGENVTVKIGPDTMKFETVVTGATARGYRLVGQSEEPGHRKTLVFTRP